MGRKSEVYSWRVSPMLKASLEEAARREGRTLARLLDQIAGSYLSSGAGAGLGEEQNDRQVFFPPDVFREYQRLVKTLVREDEIFISDRKLVKLYKLFRVRSWLLSGGTVSRDDLRLLAYLGETESEIDHLREKVPQLLGDG